MKTAAQKKAEKKERDKKKKEAQKKKKVKLSIMNTHSPIYIPDFGKHLIIC